MATSFLSSEEYDERAHRYYSQGDYDRAVEVLREGLSLYPSSTELHVGLGYAYLAQEEYAWARRAFERAIVLDAGQEDAWVGLGEALLKLGEREAALAAFERVLASGHLEDAEWLLSVGRALFREGMYERAERFFRVAARRQPDSADAAAAVGWTLHRRGLPRRAIKWLRHALDLDPECYEARAYLADVYYERGDWDLALEQLEAIPPAEHWDPATLRRLIELKGIVRGLHERHPALAVYRRRLRELEPEPDPLDRILREATQAAARARSPDQLDLFDVGPGAVRLSDQQLHRVYTPDGRCYVGRWADLAAQLRDATAPELSLREFMLRQADRWERATGARIAVDSPRAFLESAARAGALELDP
jgi:tetratricopeptide (TPR) repeat protein